MEEKKGTEKQLTYEHALKRYFNFKQEKCQKCLKKLYTFLKRLLESNKHIDETAARILLERGLTNVNNNLEYSRDIRLVAGVSSILTKLNKVGVI